MTSLANALALMGMALIRFGGRSGGGFVLRFLGWRLWLCWCGL